MNTLLKITSLLLVVALPAAFGAESYGIALPAALSTASLFGAFVVSLTLLTMFADYAGAKRLTLRHCTANVPACAPKSTLRLAA
jgi:hypothetical protein